MVIGGSPIGSTPLGAGPVQEVIDAIKAKSEIPQSAREELNEFVEETYSDLWDTFEELSQLTPPPDLLEYWELFLQILNGLM